MAEKISDDKFKSDVMRFIEVANQKFDGLTADVRTNAFKLDRLDNGLDQVREKLDGVASDLKRISGQFSDVAGMVIKDRHPRIERVEEQLGLLGSETD